MNLFPVVLACAIGVGLGLLQIRITVRLMEHPNFWLASVKLPLWGLPMLAAAYFSLYALFALTAGASLTYLGYVAVQWRKLRKGDEES